MSRDALDGFPDPEARSDADASGLLRAALEISARRRETLARLKTALEAGDDAGAIRLARIYTGIDDDEACDRTDSGVH
jgi:hypothetical protein